MKKVLFILAFSFLAFNVNAQEKTTTQDETPLAYFEVQQKMAAGNTIVDSYLLPLGSELFIYSENGNSYLSVNVPESHNRKILKLNVVSFKILN